jgi:hypothetical protein
MSPAETTELPDNKLKPAAWEIRLKEDQQRHTLTTQKWLLPLLITIYAVMLIGGVLLAFLIAPTLSTDAEASRIQNLLLATTGTLQVLAGFVGVAVGYYFRASQD